MAVVNQNLVIAQVVNLLNAHGYMAWRQENNGRIDEKKAVAELLKLFRLLAQVNYPEQKVAGLIQEILRRCYRAVPSSKKGVWDVIGINLETGKWIIVEVKLGADKLSAEQEQFGRVVRAAGGETWLCREFRSFRAGFLRSRGGNSRSD